MVDRANKEVAIEALLNTFEEMWPSQQLELAATERMPLTISRQEVGIFILVLSGSECVQLLIQTHSIVSRMSSFPVNCNVPFGVHLTMHCY